MGNESSPAASAILTLDLAALAENWRRLCRLAEGAEVAAVVKANGYGIGAAPVAKALRAAGCRSFFVAHASEGLTLRRTLPDADIYVLHGLLPGEEPAAQAAGLIATLNDLPQIDICAALGRRGRPLPAALHIDTGMTRLGLSEPDVHELARNPARLAGLDLRLVMSHLACSEEDGNPMNPRQLAEFERLRALLPAAPASLANSAGIFLGPPYRFEMVRAGVALYGANPLERGVNPMVQVVHLQGRILQTRRVDSPRTVGYGATHLADRSARIATVGVGYADGYPRSLGNRGFAHVGSQRVPVVGRVSMDLITLDVTRLPADAAEPGTLVDLMGGNVDIDELAVAAGTNTYELLTRLGPRYRRIYTGGPHDA
ncbi:MAG TPA: alanine racemase [Candidatus Cybelea sp.]|nr:alanine racemase [Candidatus Cybelea sp.]